MTAERFNESMATSLLKMAGFSIKKVVEIRNMYSTSYPDPWFLIRTEYGVIMIGWRKSVISISWELADFRGIVTEDDVTKKDDLVHAWSYEDALKYLTNLYKLMKEHSNA